MFLSLQGISRVNLLTFFDCMYPVHHYLKGYSGDPVCFQNQEIRKEIITKLMRTPEYGGKREKAETIYNLDIFILIDP